MLAALPRGGEGGILIPAATRCDSLLAQLELRNTSIEIYLNGFSQSSIPLQYPTTSKRVNHINALLERVRGIFLVPQHAATVLAALPPIDQRHQPKLEEVWSATRR